MANICEYKVKVKGKKNSCYAFYGSMPKCEDSNILIEDGSDELYMMLFTGGCKWDVDAYCEHWKGDFPVILPEDPDEAMDEANEKYMYRTVRERSKMFEVEVWCLSSDEGGSFIDLLDHYINGESAEGDCHRELQGLEETLELTSAMNYVTELLLKYSDDELIKLCETEAFFERLPVLVVDGKPSREMIAAGYLVTMTEENDWHREDFENNFEEFKDDIPENIAWMIENAK